MTCPPLPTPPLPHVGGWEYKSPLLEIKDFGPPARGGHFCENELKRNELFTSHYSVNTTKVPSVSEPCNI